MTLSEVWNSPANAPTELERQALLGAARSTIRRRQRRRVAFLAWTGLTLAATTAFATWWRATGHGELRGLWPLLIVLAAQWAVFVGLLRDLLADRRARRDAGLSLRESLEGLWREAESDRRRQVAVLALFALALPLLAASIAGLREAGKMAPHEALSAGVGLGIVGLASVAVILARLFLVVLPRGQRLATLLRQCREA